MKYRPFFNFFLGFIFVFGGALQTVGIISTTVSSLVLGVCFLMITQSSRFRFGHYLPLMVLVGIILVSTVLNHTRILLVLLYLATFVMIPFATNGFVKRYADAIHFDKIVRFFIMIASVQLPVIVLQRVFADKIVALSAHALEDVDVAYGTFWQADDHALGFLMLSLIVFLLNSKGEFVTKFARKALVCWFSLTVLLANSNISILMLGGVFAVYGITHFNLKIFFRIVAIIGLITVLLYSFSTELTARLDRTYDKIQDKENNQDTYGMGGTNDARADRTDILMFFMTQETSMLGEGPFSYYDPLKKEFSQFVNYSQYLWFYQDLGILGVASVMFFWIFYYFRFQPAKNYRLMMLALVLVYSFFTNTLSDPTFHIIFCVFMFVPDGSELGETEEQQEELPAYSAFSRLEGG